ncbi:MAG: hypothetical protein Ct9H300mP21_10440 [Pseudomonadota bacterium]|nr:MAG: hypothetical protein Ct9H300mP21_10440 [Pseudomonadota bacterium]
MPDFAYDGGRVLFPHGRIKDDQTIMSSGHILSEKNPFPRMPVPFTPKKEKPLLGPN